MQPLLEIKHLNAGYGMSQVLFDMHLRILPGQCVSLQGRNGMGKSTTIRSILAMIDHKTGEVSWRGQRIDHLLTHQIAQLGIGLVPEGRQIFPNLTVWENLIATARPPLATSPVNPLTGSQPQWTLERVYDFFPRLAQRAKNFGNQLSGGEQQMLAIGRALMTNPQLLILDEATEGLSPLLRQEIWQTLGALRQAGLSILITDKNLNQLLALCDQHFIIEKGQCVWSGDSAAFKADGSIKQRYLTA